MHIGQRLKTADRMTPTAHRLIFLKMFMKLRKQIKTAQITKSLIICKKVFLFALFAQKRKKREKGKLPRTPLRKEQKRKEKEKKKKFIVNRFLLT